MECCHFLVLFLFSGNPVLLWLAHCKVHAVMQNLGFDQSHLVIGWNKVALLLKDTPKNVFCNAKILAGAKELEEFVSIFVDLGYSKFSKVVPTM